MPEHQHLSESEVQGIMTVLQVLAVVFSLAAVCIAGLTLSLLNSLEYEIDVLEGVLQQLGQRVERLEAQRSLADRAARVPLLRPWRTSR